MTNKENQIRKQFRKRIQKNMKVNNQMLSNSEGITLVALVITIVVIIILAMITIKFLFGENGLITKTQEAKKMTEIEEVREKLEMATGTAIIDGKGKTTIDDYFELIEHEGIIGNKDSDTLDNADGTYDVTTNEGFIFQVMPVPEKDNADDILINYVGEASGPRIKKITATTTTNSATIGVEAVNVENATYKYEYKKDGEDSWQTVEGENSSTCTINNLEENEIYIIRVTVEVASGGNKGTATREVNVITKEMPTGAITFEQAIWQGDGTASVVVHTSEEGYTIQYQILETGSITNPEELDGVNWKTVGNGEKVTGVEHNETIYARLWDGFNGSSYASASIKDDTKPQVAKIQLSENTTDTESSITATVTLIDNESGVNAQQSKWVYNTKSGNIGTNETEYTGGSFTNNSQELILSATTVGTYYLHVLTKDRAGNVVESVSDGVLVEDAIPTTVEEAKESETKFTDTTPITDDLGNTVYIPGGFHVDKESEGTLVEDGIVIEDDNGNQFVWIPTGTYKTKEGEKVNELARRSWMILYAEQNPTIIKGDSAIIDEIGYEYYGEGDSRSCTISNGMNSIDAFLKNAKPIKEGGHNGFYIGRYEQGVGNVCKAGAEAYTNITRDKAKAEAESMFEGRPEIKATSQLISSYAWDTVLNFICQNSEQGYTLAMAYEKTYANIDTNNKMPTGEYAVDCYSNIYDFLGNCKEWTTEYNDSPILGVFRGGSYNSSMPVCYRDYVYTTIEKGDYISFRLQLYVE